MTILTRTRFNKFVVFYENKINLETKNGKIFILNIETQTWENKLNDIQFEETWMVNYYEDKILQIIQNRQGILSVYIHENKLHKKTEIKIQENIFDNFRISEISLKNNSVILLGKEKGNFEVRIIKIKKKEFVNKNLKSEEKIIILPEICPVIIAHNFQEFQKINYEKCEIIFEKQKQIELLKKQFLFENQIEKLNRSNKINLKKLAKNLERKKKKRKELCDEIEINLEHISLNECQEEIREEKIKLMHSVFGKLTPNFQGFPVFLEKIRNHDLKFVEKSFLISLVGNFKEVMAGKIKFYENLTKLKEISQSFKETKSQSIEIITSLERRLCEKCEEFRLFRKKPNQSELKIKEF